MRLSGNWPLVDGADQSGRTLRTDGWWPGTKVRRGEGFVVTGDFMRHKVRGARYLTQRIRVTADCEADRAGRLMMPVDELTKLTIDNARLYPVSGASMNSRRRFLAQVSAGVVGVAASPTSFFDMGPSVALGAERGYNSLLSTDMITREALRMLENNLTFAKRVNRDYDEGWERLAERQLFRKGDIISFGAPKLFKVNARTRMPIGRKLKQFLVEVEMNG